MSESIAGSGLRDRERHLARPSCILHYNLGRSGIPVPLERDSQPVAFACINLNEHEKPRLSVPALRVQRPRAIYGCMSVPPHMPLAGHSRRLAPASSAGESPQWLSLMTLTPAQPLGEAGNVAFKDRVGRGERGTPLYEGALDRVAEIVDRVHLDAGQQGDGRIHVPRDGQVDE
jgi:hypothetical protein